MDFAKVTTMTESMGNLDNHLIGGSVVVDDEVVGVTHHGVLST